MLFCINENAGAAACVISPEDMKSALKNAFFPPQVGKLTTVRLRIGSA